MKVGDLVKYMDSPEGTAWGKTYGVITEVKSHFSSGGGGSWPESGYHVYVLWSNGEGSWVTNEYPFALEVMNESA